MAPGNRQEQKAIQQTRTPGSQETPKEGEEIKKLALSEQIRTALPTQAGMSSEAASRLWEESCRDSGNA